MFPWQDYLPCFCFNFVQPDACFTPYPSLSQIYYFLSLLFQVQFSMYLKWDKLFFILIYFVRSQRWLKFSVYGHARGAPAWQPTSGSGFTPTPRWRLWSPFIWTRLPMYVTLIRVARFFLVQTYQNVRKYTKWPQTIPKGHKLCQMDVKYSKWSLNMTKFSIPRNSKFYQNWDFSFENKPSGNPDLVWKAWKLFTL
jgi:hypothetical protein